MPVSPGSWLSGLLRFGSSGKALPSWWAALMGGMSGSSYPLVDAEALVAGAGALRRAAGRLDERAVAFQRFALGLSAVMPGAGSMMASTLVSVGQPSRDGADGLRECADGLREQAAQVDYAQKSAEVTALVTLWMVAQLVWVVATTGGVSAALIPEVLAGGRRSVEEIVAELLSAMRSGAVFGSVQDLAIQLSQQREYRDGLDVTSLLIAGVGGMAGGLGDVAGRGLVSGVAGPELLRRLVGGALGGVIGADAGVVVSTAWQGGPWDASVFAEATAAGAGTGMFGGALHHAVVRRRTAFQQALHGTAVTERPAQSPTGEPGVAERTAPKRPAAVTSGGTGEMPASDPATGPALSYERSDWRSRERNWVQAVARAQGHPLVREVQALAPERLRAWQDALPATHRQQLDLLVKPLMAPADSPAPAALFPEPAELVELRATFAGELALHRLTDPGTTADHVLKGERRRPTDRAVIADGHARHAFLGAADRQTVAADRRAGRLPGGAPSHGSEPVRHDTSGAERSPLEGASGPSSLPATASSGESSVALPHPPAVPALPMPVVDRLAHQLRRELTGEEVNAPALLSLLHQATADSRPLQPVAEHYERSHHQSLAEELFQARAKGRLSDEAYALALDTMASAPTVDLSRLDLAAFVADLDSAVTSGDERRLNRLLRSLRRTIPLVFDVEDAYAARSAGGLSLQDDLRHAFPEHGEYFGFLLGHDNNLETKVIGPAEALHWHATAERTTFVDDAGAELPVPFDYPEDGCYARAHVVAKMLSRSGVYSRKVFAVWDNPALGLVAESENAAGAMPGAPGKVRWMYHVAPLVLVDEGAGRHVETVIDPSLSNKPQPLSRWLATMGVHSYARLEGFETDPQEFLRDVRDRKRQPVSSGGLGFWGYPKDTPVVFTTGRVNLNHVFRAKPLLTREEPSSLRFPEMTWGPDKGKLSTYSSEARYRGELRTVRTMLQQPQTTALELRQRLKTSPFAARIRQDPLVARPLSDRFGESVSDDLIVPRVIPARLPDLPPGPVPPLHPPTGTAHPAPLIFPAGAAAVAPSRAARWKRVLDDLPVHDGLRTVVVPYLSGDGIPHSSAGPLTLDDFKGLAKAAGWQPGSDLRVVFAALHPDAADGYDHRAYTAYLRRAAQSLDHDHPTDGGGGVDIYTVGTLAPDLSLAPATHPNAPKEQEDFTAEGTHDYWGHWVRIATHPDRPPRFTSGGGQLHPVTPHHPNTARQEAVESHTHPFDHAPGHPEPADGVVISAPPIAKADPPALAPQPGLFTVIPRGFAPFGHPNTTDHAGKPFVITPGLLARALRRRGYSGQDLLWQVAYPPEHRAAAVRYLLDLSTELGGPDIYLPAAGSTGFTVDDGYVKNRAHGALAYYERLTTTPDVPARFTAVDGTLRRHHPTATPPIDPVESGTPHAPDGPTDSAPPSPSLSPAHQTLVEKARKATTNEIETWWKEHSSGHRDLLQEELRERTAVEMTLPEDPNDLRRCAYLLELALLADLEDDFATLCPHLFSSVGRSGETSSHPVGAGDATDSAPPFQSLSPAHQTLVEKARKATTNEIETWWKEHSPGHRDLLQEELQERTADRVTLPEDPKDLRRCAYLLELALLADLEDDFATLYPHLFSSVGRSGETSSHPVGAGDATDSAPPFQSLSPAHQTLVEKARKATTNEIETWWKEHSPGHRDLLQEELQERTADRVTLPEDPKDLRRCTYLLELALLANLEDDFATLYPHLFSDVGRSGETSSHPVGAGDATAGQDSRPGRTTPPVRPDEPGTPLQEVSPPPARSDTPPTGADPSSTAHGLPAGPTEPAQPAAVTSPPRLPTDAWPAGLREKARDFLRGKTASVLTEDQLALAERTLDLVTANDRSATAHPFASEATIRVYRRKTADILRKIAPSIDLRTYDPTKPLPLPGSEARLLSIHSVTTPNGRPLPRPVVEAVTRTVVAYQRGSLRNEPAISATTAPARKDLDTPPGSARPAVTRRPVVKTGTRFDDTTPAARRAGTGVAPRAFRLPTVALPATEEPHPPGATNRTRTPGSGRTGPVPSPVTPHRRTPEPAVPSSHRARSHRPTAPAPARPERPRTAPAGVPPTPPNTTAPGSATRGTRLTTRPNTTRAKQPPVERQPGSRQKPGPQELLERTGLPSEGSAAARFNVHLATHLTEAATTLRPRLDPRDPLTRLRRHVFGTTPATDTELLGLAHTLIDVNYPITPDTLRALQSLTPLLTPGTTTPSPEALTTVVLGIPDPRPEDVCDLLDIAKALLDFNDLRRVHHPFTIDILKRAAEGHAPDQNIRAT
ncbi:protein-glutamine glutaminase family protein [Kitasatospora sp. NPDC093102]|uniref:protein-glutamine glutaminase family protein n=1 Tax=Kitasatospora sp. NPDC093102 TaxID=3155069 RepID=UPI0034300B19